MTLVYATRDELVAYTPAKYKTRVPDEPEASRLLTEASKEVLLATRTAVYETDTMGYPSDTAVRSAFRDATCAQAVWWIIPGNEGEELGTSDDYQSVSIGSVSLSKKAGGSGARQEGLPVGGSGRLCPKAAVELANAGLSPGSIRPYPNYWFGW